MNTRRSARDDAADHAVMELSWPEGTVAFRTLIEEMV